jgi:DNA-binding NarL/FixJ family response regulator
VGTASDRQAPLATTGRVVRGFLVVEDDLLVGNALRRLISRSAPVTWATTIEKGKDALGSATFGGLVLDVNLPDGDGLDFLRHVRNSGITVPAIVITGREDRRLANTCYSLSAACVYKPEILEHVASFVRRTLASAGAHGERTRLALEHLAAQRHLTPRELEVVELATNGVTRENLAAALGVSENTVKTLIRRLLARCDESSLDDVVRVVLAAMAEGASGTDAT